MRLNNRGTKNAEEITGSNEPLPGLYHVALQGVDESFTKYKDSVVLEFQVLAGTIPSQEGKVHREFFSTKGAGEDRLRKIAMYFGILGPDEEKDIEFKEALGRQIVIDCEEHEYQGKKYIRMPFMGFWNIGHPKVSHVPLCQAALKVAGNGALPMAADQPGTGAPVVPVNGKSDPWRDL